jgi:hypothetical protein
MYNSTWLNPELARYISVSIHKTKKEKKKKKKKKGHNKSN